MSKCKCKWRRDGVVLDEECTRIVRRWYCEIDSYNPGIGCCRNCNDYTKNEKEMETNSLSQKKSR